MPIDPNSPPPLPAGTQLRMDLCREIMAGSEAPLLFATISGAHLYGFPSPDSDYDLRGVHILPAREVLSLHEPRETLELEGVISGVEIDLVTHDAAKFFRLLLKKNGYVLEQLLSPLIVHTTPEHAELVAMAPGFLTKHHAYHYLGFAETQWRLFAKENPPRVKPLLYTYRVLLTGIHLVRTGVLCANLVQLNDEYKLPYIEGLIARKTGGIEKQKLTPDPHTPHTPDTLSHTDLAFHESEYTRLRARLEAEHAASSLPESSTAQTRNALSDLLVRLRLG